MPCQPPLTTPCLRCFAAVRKRIFGLVGSAQISLALASYVRGPVPTMQDSILLTTTRALYRERPASLKPSKIAADTGLSLHWLKDFGWARPGDPGITKVETLYTYLSGKPLNLGE